MRLELTLHSPRRPCRVVALLLDDGGDGDTRVLTRGSLVPDAAARGASLPRRSSSTSSTTCSPPVAG